MKKTTALILTLSIAGIGATGYLAKKTVSNITASILSNFEYQVAQVQVSQNIDELDLDAMDQFELSDYYYENYERLSYTEKRKILDKIREKTNATGEEGETETDSDVPDSVTELERIRGVLSEAPFQGEPEDASSNKNLSDEVSKLEFIPLKEDKLSTAAKSDLTEFLLGGTQPTTGGLSGNVFDLGEDSENSGYGDINKAYKDLLDKLTELPPIDSYNPTNSDPDIKVENYGNTSYESPQACFDACLENTIEICEFCEPGGITQGSCKSYFLPGEKEEFCSLSCGYTIIESVTEDLEEVLVIS